MTFDLTVEANSYNVLYTGEYAKKVKDLLKEKMAAGKLVTLRVLVKFNRYGHRNERTIHEQAMDITIKPKFYPRKYPNESVFLIELSTRPHQIQCSLMWYELLCDLFRGEPGYIKWEVTHRIPTKDLPFIRRHVLRFEKGYPIIPSMTKSARKRGRDEE